MQKWLPRRWQDLPHQPVPNYGCGIVTELAYIVRAPALDPACRGERAGVIIPPVAMAATPLVRPATSTGVKRSVVESSLRWPFVFAPALDPACRGECAGVIPPCSDGYYAAGRPNTSPVSNEPCWNCRRAGRGYSSPST